MVEYQTPRRTNMKSMLRITRKCQAIPNMERGIVVGVDVSKRRLNYGAFRLDEMTGVVSVTQDRDGFESFRMFLDDLKLQGYEPWVAFEPTGHYSTCFKEWLYCSGEHVIQVNPYHVKRTKEVIDNSPEKDDDKDPAIIADLVWHGRYQQVASLDGVYAELRAASVEWSSRSKKRTALRNEFQGLLEVWFPELTEVFKDGVCKSVKAIVRKYKDTDAIACSRLSSIRTVLKKASRGMTVKRAEDISIGAKSSIAPKNGQGSRRRAMLNLLDMLELVEKRQDSLKQEMSEMLQGLHDARSLLSLPRIGTITVAGLLGECGDLGKYGSYEQLEKFIGLNLYEVSSGKHKGKKHISKRGRALARYLLCHIAMLQIKSGGLFEEFAKQLKSKGKKTGEIRVAVARKLLKLLYAIARDRMGFDPQRFFTEARAEDGPVIQQGTQAKTAA
jgi:transposase